MSLVSNFFIWGGCPPLQIFHMRKCITRGNHDPSAGREIPVGPSLTIPDQAMSLEELIARHTRGQSVVQLQPVYLGEDEDTPDVTRMDKIEQIEYGRSLATYTQGLRDRLRKKLDPDPVDPPADPVDPPADPEL